MAIVLVLPLSDLNLKIGLLKIGFYGFENAILTMVFITPYRKHFISVVSSLCELKNRYLPRNDRIVPVSFVQNEQNQIHIIA
jgi:hypothetical protein